MNIQTLQSTGKVFGTLSELTKVQPKVKMQKGFFAFVNRMEMIIRHYRMTYRYNRRYLKSLVGLALAFMLAVSRPPLIPGVPQGMSTSWLFVAILAPPGMTFAAFLFTAVAVIIVGAVACFFVAGMLASILSYRAAYPNGEGWRLIYLIWEVVAAWVCFLPVHRYGLGALNAATASAGVLLLLSQATLAFASPGFTWENVDIWAVMTVFLPNGLIMVAILFGLALIQPESFIERLRDAEVDLLRSIKRGLVIEIASVRGEDVPPQEIVSRFTVKDVEVGKRRKFPAIGEALTRESFENFLATTQYEVEQVLGYRGSSALELFCWSRDDPNDHKDLADAIQLTLQSMRSLGASARLMADMTTMKVGKIPLSVEPDVAGKGVVWQYVGSCLDGIERLIQIIDPNGKPVGFAPVEEEVKMNFEDVHPVIGIGVDGGTLGRLKLQLEKVTSQVMGVLNSEDSRLIISSDTEGLVLKGAQKLAVIDLLSFGERLINALSLAEDLLRKRDTGSRFGTFHMGRRPKVAAKKQSYSSNFDDLGRLTKTRHVAMDNPRLSDLELGKGGFTYNFVKFATSDDVVLSNYVALFTFLMLIWSVIPQTEVGFAQNKVVWMGFPFYFSYCADSLGASTYRNFWRIVVTIIGVILAIIACLPDYGTNPFSVGIIGYFWCAFMMWIIIYAPEFSDVANIGSLAYVYVCWATYGSPPNPSTFQPGVTGGLRLAWNILGILIGTLFYLISRPKFSRSRVRQRLAKLLLDIQACMEIFVEHARNPDLWNDELRTDRLSNALVKSATDSAAVRKELDIARGEPGTVYPWNTMVYDDMYSNADDAISRLLAVHNYYRWLYQKFTLSNVHVAADSGMYGQEYVYWLHDLAMSLLTEQAPQIRTQEMRDVLVNSFQSGLRDQTTFVASPTVENVVGGGVVGGGMEVGVKHSNDTIPTLGLALVHANLERIQADICKLYGVREDGSPFTVKLD